MWNERCLARGKLYQQNLSDVWACAQEQGGRAGVPLCEQEVWLHLASGWRWSSQHPTKVSGLSPSSWAYGTPHGHEVSTAYPRSSLGERVPARKRLRGQLRRSRWTLVHVECHTFHVLDSLV